MDYETYGMGCLAITAVAVVISIFIHLALIFILFGELILFITITVPETDLWYAHPLKTSTAIFYMILHALLSAFSIFIFVVMGG